MNEKITMSRDELREIIQSTVTDTLVKIGVDPANPIEMQRDFQHLREWRESTEAVKRKSILTVIGVIASGIIAAIVMAIDKSN